MARQYARAGRPMVGNRRRSILSDNIHIEIYQPFPTDGRRHSAHAVRGVAYRTTKTVL